MTAVRVRGLRVVRGGRVVIPGLSVDVEAGRVTGLLGPSGSGKTTLFRAVVGVQRLAGGTVEVLGRPAGAADLRSRVAYMTQGSSFYPDLTIEENLRFFASLLGSTEGAVGDVLDAVDLQPERQRVVGRLSGGQQARVSLAAALVGAPDVLVLDEPTVGLDPVLRRRLWQLFHRLADDGAAVLVSSHVMDEADRCDELLLLRDGLLLAHGTPAELRRRTQAHDLEEAFLRLVDAAAA